MVLLENGSLLNYNLTTAVHVGFVTLSLVIKGYHASQCLSIVLHVTGVDLGFAKGGS